MRWLWLTVFTVATINISYAYVDYPAYFPLTGQTDAHWTSNVPGYYTYTNGVMVWNTNTAQFWQTDWRERTWKQDTNGWRVQITCYTDAPPVGSVTVEVGSVTVDSGTNYYLTPDSKFAKFELVNTNGAVIPPKRGASLEGSYPRRLEHFLFR